jgi:CheY-like chemotaxis protein
MTDREDSSDSGRVALHEALAQLEVAVQARTRQLEASEARYRTLFEHSPEMLLLVDERGRITAANRASVEQLGRSEQSLRGTPFADLFEAEPGREVELDRERGEQERRLHGGPDVTATVASLPGTEPVRLVSLRDASAKRALVDAQRLAALEQLAAGVAHEVNNPLAVLRMGLEQLALHLAGDRSTLRDVLVLVEHCDRIARIVENLSALARPGAPDRMQADAHESQVEAAELARRGLGEGKGTPPAPTPRPGLRVLCVEDEPVLRNLLAAMLRELGHHPTMVRSAEEAVEVLDAGVFDAVLTDIQLPGETGHWLQRTIIERHPALAEQVILMSGHFQTIPAGQRCLPKPFGFDELGRALAELGREGDTLAPQT